jgi:hypothetical protein
LLKKNNIFKKYHWLLEEKLQLKISMGAIRNNNNLKSHVLPSEKLQFKISMVAKITTTQNLICCHQKNYNLFSQWLLK